ncbi:hypothetical protein H3L96_00135 [Neisseria wadsworthii]|nr:hypothetical protein H3L96_00135 [Neisseria wadsworthii]
MHFIRRPCSAFGLFQTGICGKRAWLSEAQYASLVAMCQFIPGPASSQMFSGFTIQ